jgi:DNA-binding beta-propeller fold protein YncE
MSNLYSLTKRYGGVVVVCVVAAVGAAVMLGSTCALFNKAPTVPVISSPSAGVVGVPVVFKATATDPDGDSVAFQFEWGDTTTPAWSIFVASDETISVAHTYTDSGPFVVRARAKDAVDKVSALSGGVSLRVGPASPPYPDTIIGKLPVLETAIDAVVTPDGRMLYIGYGDGNVLTPVRLADRTVLDTVSVGRGPTRMTVSPDGGHVFACPYRSGKLVSVRTSDNVVEHELTLASHTKEVAITPDGQFAYVVAPDSECMYKVRTSDFAVVGNIRLRPGGHGLAIVPSVGCIYVSLDSGVGVVDISEGRLVQTVAVGSTPSRLAASPDGQHVYAVVQADSSLVDIRTATNTVVSRIKISEGVLTVAVTPDGAYVLAVDQHGLWYVDAATGVVVGSLRCYYGGLPAVFPDGDTIYIPARETLFVVGRS